MFDEEGNYLYTKPEADFGLDLERKHRILFKQQALLDDQADIIAETN